MACILERQHDLPWAFVPSLFQHGPENREPFLRKRMENVTNMTFLCDYFQIKRLFLHECINILALVFVITSKKPANDFQGAVL